MKKQLINFKRWIFDHLNLEYKVGMRVIKTSLLIMICLIISEIMHYDTNFMIIASSSAVVTLQTSQKDTLQSSLFRTLGTIFGGVLGVLSLFIGQFLPFYSEILYVIVIPIMIIINLYICNVFRLQNASVISCIVLLIISTNIYMPIDEALVFAAKRLTDTLVGVTVTTIFNNLIWPPKKAS